MINAGIKEVKNNLSRFLARVKEGEEVVITERGKPIARIVKEGQGRGAVYTALIDLVEKGVVSLPGRDIRKDGPDRIAASGSPVSEMVIEDRR